MSRCPVCGGQLPSLQADLEPRRRRSAGAAAPARATPHGRAVLARAPGAARAAPPAHAALRARVVLPPTPSARPSQRYVSADLDPGKADRQLGALDLPGRAPSTRSSAATCSSTSTAGSRPLPVSTPVSRPTAGSMTTRAAAAQGRHVLLGGGVLPHLGVHRGREDDRTAGGEQGVGEQVVGEAVGGLGEHVGGGRGDHDQVGVPGRCGRAGPRGRRPRPRWRPGGRTAPTRWRRRRSAARRRSGTTRTSWPDSVSRRSSSHAL